MKKILAAVAVVLLSGCAVTPYGGVVLSGQPAGYPVYGSVVIQPPVPVYRPYIYPYRAYRPYQPRYHYHR